jgi:hypothetical protein
VALPAPADRGDAGLRVTASANLRDWQIIPELSPAAGSARCVLPEGMRFARLEARANDGAVFDSDGDGLHDLFEETLAGGPPGTDRIPLDQVAPDEDADGDGVPNVLETDNHAPGPAANPGPALIDPRQVAAAAAAAPPRDPPELDVHTPLDGSPP